MKLWKSFKPVILQLMAFRFLKQVGTTRSSNLVVAVNDDYILDVEGVLSVLTALLSFFAMWSLMSWAKDIASVNLAEIKVEERDKTGICFKQL